MYFHASAFYFTGSWHFAIRDGLKAMAISRCALQPRPGAGVVLASIAQNAGMTQSRALSAAVQFAAMFVSLDGSQPYQELELCIQHDGTVRVTPQSAQALAKRKSQKWHSVVGSSKVTSLEAGDQLISVGHRTVADIFAGAVDDRQRVEALVYALADLPDPQALKFQRDAGERREDDYDDVVCSMKVGQRVLKLRTAACAHAQARCVQLQHVSESAAASPSAQPASATTGSASGSMQRTAQSLEKWSTFSRVEAVAVAAPAVEFAQARRAWREDGVMRGRITGRFTGKYSGVLELGAGKLFVRMFFHDMDPNAVQVCDTSTQAAVAGYLDRATASLVTESLREGCAVSVEYVGSCERTDSVRLMCVPPVGFIPDGAACYGVQYVAPAGSRASARPAAPVQRYGTVSGVGAGDRASQAKRGASADARASAARGKRQRHGSEDAEDAERLADDDAARVRRCAGSTAAPFGFSSVADDELAKAYVREAFPNTDAVSVGSVVMALFNETDGWYRAEVTDVRRGNPPFGVKWTADNKTAWVSFDMIGRLPCS